MNLEASKKTLKVVGIIEIVLGVLVYLVGILAAIGGSFITMGVYGDNIPALNAFVAQGLNAQQLGSFATLGAVLFILIGTIGTIEGVLYVRGANNFAKITPAWIFSIIGLVISAYLIYITAMSIINHTATIATIITNVLEISISILVFIAANSIRNATKK